MRKKKQGLYICLAKQIIEDGKNKKKTHAKNF